MKLVRLDGTLIDEGESIRLIAEKHDYAKAFAEEVMAHRETKKRLARIDALLATRLRPNLDRMCERFDARDASNARVFATSTLAAVDSIEEALR